MSLRIVFAGSGAFGLPTLSALKSQVVQVVTQPDRPAGRGRKPTPTPIAAFATQHDLPMLRTDDINGESLPDADVLLVIAFGQKIAAEVAGKPRLGSMNLHASLLPKFRGAAPIAWTILSGQKLAGNSVIRLADKMDAGAILAQSRLEIGETETAGELHDRLAQDGVALIERVIADCAAGRAIETPQDSSLASQAPKLRREDARIDWAQNAETIARRIRGLWPWPGCRARLCDAGGEMVAGLTLARARPAGGEGGRWHDGEIDGAANISVAGGTEAVEILELQPEGKRVMSLADFRRGHAWMPGMRIIESPLHH